MGFINQYAPSTHFLDEKPEQVKLRRELGFTRCIVGNDRRPLAWAMTYKGAALTVRRMLAERQQTLVIVRLQ